MNALWLLMLAVGVVGSNSLVLSPIAGDVSLSFPGHAATDVLLASAVYGIGTAISALTIAPKADQFGLARSVYWALMILALALCLSAVAPTLLVLIVAQGLAGIAAGVALPAIYGLTAEISPPGQESASLGKVLTGWTLSLVAGVSLSAILSDVVHWRVVYLAMAVFAALVTFLMAGSIPVQSKPKAVSGTSPLTALRIPGVFGLLGSVVAYMTAFYGLYAYLGTHLTQFLGLSTAMAGVAALAYGIGFGIAAPLDRLIDKYGSSQTAPFIFAALIAVYICIAASTSSVVFIYLACLFWGAANHLGLNVLVGSLTAISPTQRSAIMGLYSAVTYGAMFVGTILFRPIFEHFGFTATAVVAALCISPALVQAILVRRAHWLT